MVRIEDELRAGDRWWRFVGDAARLVRAARAGDTHAEHGAALAERAAASRGSVEVGS